MRYVASLVLVLAVTAGCLGGGGADVIRGEASNATVDDDALAETGYERHRAEAGWLNTTLDVELGGDVELSSSPEVEARTRVTEYRRAGDPAVAFAVYATPAVRPVESIDATVNLATLSDTEDLAADVQTEYASVEGATHVRNETVTLLGNETTLRVYEATATADGEPVDVVIAVASVEHGGDHVTAVSVAPASVHDPETVASLIGAVSHEK